MGCPCGNSKCCCSESCTCVIDKCLCAVCIKIRPQIEAPSSSEPLARPQQEFSDDNQSFYIDDPPSSSAEETGKSGLAHPIKKKYLKAATKTEEKSKLVHDEPSQSNIFNAVPHTIFFQTIKRLIKNQGLESSNSTNTNSSNITEENENNECPSRSQTNASRSRKRSQSSKNFRSSENEGASSDKKCKMQSSENEFQSTSSLSSTGAFPHTSSLPHSSAFQPTSSLPHSSAFQPTSSFSDKASIPLQQNHPEMSIEGTLTRDIEDCFDDKIDVEKLDEDQDRSDTNIHGYNESNPARNQSEKEGAFCDANIRNQFNRTIPEGVEGLAFSLFQHEGASSAKKCKMQSSENEFHLTSSLSPTAAFPEGQDRSDTNNHGSNESNPARNQSDREGAFSAVNAPNQFNTRIPTIPREFEGLAISMFQHLIPRGEIERLAYSIIRQFENAQDAHALNRIADSEDSDDTKKAPTGKNEKKKSP